MLAASASRFAGTVVVLVGLPEERAAMRDLLNVVTVSRHPTGTRYDAAVLPTAGWQVVVGTVGRGNRAAAVMAERAISWFEPAAVIVTGIAGALHPRLRLGDVVVATRVYAIHGGRDDPRGFGVRPESWEADHWLLQLAEDVASDRGWLKRLAQNGSAASVPSVHFAPTGAGDVVLNSTTSILARRLRGAFNDAVAIDTEDAGVVQAAHLHHRTPVLAVRSISDLVEGHEAPAEGSWRSVAAAHAAGFALELAGRVAEEAYFLSLPVDAAPDTLAHRHNRHADSASQALSPAVIHSLPEPASRP